MPGLVAAEPTQGGIDLVFGMLANAARVKQDQIRVARFVGDRIAQSAQRADDQFAVQHVHLAADGLDVELLGHEDII